MKDIERIFGLLNWSRKFIKNFAEKAEPISKLLQFRRKRGIHISKYWTKEADNARRLLVNEILENDTKLSIINRDAS